MKRAPGHVDLWGETCQLLSSLDIALCLEPLAQFSLTAASLRLSIGDEELDLAIFPTPALGLGGPPKKASRSLTYSWLVPWESRD